MDRRKPQPCRFGRRFLPKKPKAWLIEQVAMRTGLSPELVHVATPFLEFGLGSMDAVQIAGELELRLGRHVSPTAVYNYPSIAALAEWLSHPPSDEETFAEAGYCLLGVAETTPERIYDDVRNMSDDDIQTFLLHEMAKV